VLTYVLGAPGSGKTTVSPLLQQCLPNHIVVDWDAFMKAASALAGREVRRNPDTWPSYRSLVRAIVESIRSHPTVLLGVCTPDELDDWPIDVFVLLDCSDDQRQERLRRLSPDELADAIADARQYRALDLPMIDTTDRRPQDIASALAELIART
jgi:broad-specificity NMP kinase